MRCISQVLLCALIALLIPAEARAVVPDQDPGHFQVIPERNVFALKAPPQAVATNPPPAVPKLLLTGITTVLGNKRAFLKELALTPPGAKPDQSKDLYLMLTEGQREGNVEVLQIDERAGSVKVNNSGNITTLTFEKDGEKLPSTPLAAGPGAQAGIAAANPQVGIPTSNPPGMSAAQTNIGMRQFPSRPLRWPMNGKAAAAPAAPPGTATIQVPSPTGYPGIPVIPAPSGLDPGPVPQANDIPPGLTADEQRLVQQFRNASQPPPLAPPAVGSGNFEAAFPKGIAPAFSQPTQAPTPLLPQ